MPISEMIESLVDKTRNLPIVWRKEKRDLEISRIFGTETKKQGIFPNAFQNYKRDIMKVFPFYSPQHIFRHVEETSDASGAVVEGLVPPTEYMLAEPVGDTVTEADPPYASVTPPPEEDLPAAAADNCDS